MTDEPKLATAPTVHADVTLHEVTFGVYNEVGADSHLEYVRYGDYTYNGPRCILQNVDVGPFANIAAAVRIGATAHPMERATQHHFTYRRVLYGFAEEDDEAFFARRREQRAVLEADTWIGHGAILMPDVRIGVGAVVGAGAVVTRDVEAYGVAVGSPARVIKRRFDEATIAALLEIAWWRWSHAQLRAALEAFSGPVDAFIEAYRDGPPTIAMEEGA